MNAHLRSPDDSAPRTGFLKATALAALVGAGLLALIVVYSHWAHGEEPKIALLLLLGITFATARAVAGALLAQRRSRGGLPLSGLNAAVGLFLLWLFRLL